MFPRRVRDLTAEWLTGVLAGDGLDGSSVESLEVEPMARTGLLATLVRVRPTYARPAAGLPATLVVKLPSDNANNREIGRRFAYYRREAVFYREIADRVPTRTPRAFAVLTDGDEATLVLEDLSTLHLFDQIVGADEARSRAAMRAIAGVHAATWGRMLPEDLPGPTDPLIAGYEEIFELTWPAFVERLGHRLPVGAVEAGEAAMSRFGEICARWAAGPLCITHGDFRLDNLRYEAHTDRAAVLDWQLAQRSRGALDVARWLCGSVSPGLRREIGDQLIEEYHAVLVAGGVTDYELGQCITDVRDGIVLHIPNPVSAAVVVDPGDERGDRLLTTMAERTFAAVVDLATLP